MSSRSWDGFISFLECRARWSLHTFGPGDRHRGIVEHIRRELSEIEKDPTDLFEWIDVINLALDGAARSCGATGMDVVCALLDKHEINLARSWPDWRAAAPDEPIEHVRDVTP